MRRFRTRTTAWPAVADLMTVLAVVGLVCAVFLVQEVNRLTAIITTDPIPREPGKDPRIDTLKKRSDSLQVEVDSLNARVEHREAVIDSLQATADSLEKKLATRRAGFEACWPSRDTPRGFLFTYNVQIQDGKFSFAMHKDWAPNTEFRRTIPPAFVQVLEEMPQYIDGTAVRSFGDRINAAKEQWKNYPPECKFAVTINSSANGDSAGILTAAVFYPIWR